VGEVLLTTPAIRGFHEAFPDAEIDVVLDKAVEDVVSGLPYVHNIVTLDQNHSTGNLIKTGLELRRSGYDISVDFLANPRSAFLSLLTNAPVRIGLEKRIRKWVYKDYIRPSPEATPFVADIRLNALRLLDLNVPDLHMDFQIREDGVQNGERHLSEAGIAKNESFVAFAPVSLRVYKRWAPSSFAAVADYITKEHGIRVTLIGGPGEKEFLEETAASMKEKPAGIFELHDLNTMGYLLKRSLFYIGNDSGVRHLASAVQIPTLTIFGPSNPENWNEPDDPRHIALSKSISCRAPKCHRDCRYDYHCLNLVTVEEAKNAVDKIIRTL